MTLGEWVIQACANLYKELIKVGVTATMADQMELWQIACYFEQAGSASDQQYNSLKERWEAWRAGLPDPVTEKPPPPGVPDIDPGFMSGLMTDGGALPLFRPAQ